MVRPLYLFTILTAFLLPACGGGREAPTLHVASQPTFVLIFTEN